MVGRSMEQHRLDSMNIAELFRTCYNLTTLHRGGARGRARGGHGHGDALRLHPCRRGRPLRLHRGQDRLCAGHRLRVSIDAVGRNRRVIFSFRPLHRRCGSPRLGLSLGHPGGAAQRRAQELSIPARQQPSSMRATKHLLHRQEIERLSRNCGPLQLNAELRATDDFREGISAFLEKRNPVWPSRC